MRWLGVVIGSIILGGTLAAEERSLRFTANERLFPPMKGIAIVKAGEPGPDAPKHRAIAVVAKYKETAKLPSEGPFDVWWQPKSGMAVRVTAGLTLRNDEVKEIKLDDYLGVVNVRGDGQPRVGLITIAPQDDPGPGEKGHVAVQTGKEFRADMVVPGGFFSVWITPENGARPRKIVDRVKVQAGKAEQLD
jgi:hypothetical protein